MQSKITSVKKMKIARIIVKALFSVMLIFDVAVFGSLIYLNQSITPDFMVKKGETLNIEAPLPVTAVYNGTELSAQHTLIQSSSLNIDLKVFGVIPLSKASVQVVDEQQVAVLGQPFGMKLYTDGVLVVDITDVKTAEGNLSPARLSGLKKGDYIRTVDGKTVSTNEDLIDVVESSDGRTLKMKIIRESKALYLDVIPKIDSETGKYKLGVWVRDSSAGIGMLTFYSPATNIICGLGHGVCDEDTGKLLTVKQGEIVTAQIYDVEKGKKGTAGQLKGRLTSKGLGEICLNSNGGLYSVLTGEISLSTLTEVALKSEVKNGEAQILCTLEGENPKAYSCKIELKKGAFNKETQNMTVTVTDEELLEKTGGIVQGL